MFFSTIGGLASPPESCWNSPNAPVASAQALLADKFSPSQYLNFSPSLCEGDDEEQSVHEDEESDREEEQSGKAMEEKLQHYSTESLGAEPPEEDNTMDPLTLTNASFPPSLSSTSIEDRQPPPHSRGTENDRADLRTVAGTQPDASDGEEEVNHTVDMQLNEPIPISVNDEEERGETPPESSDDEEADPKIVAQSKEPSADLSSDEDDDPSESDLTAVGDGRPADAVGLKDPSSDSMAVDEGQPMGRVDFERSLGGPAARIEDDPMTDEPDGPNACVEEDDLMGDDEPKKPLGEEDSSDEEFKKSSDGEDGSDDESKKSSDGEDGSDDESKKSSDGEDGPDIESKKSSDGEDDPMNVDESLQRTALFEPRRSSRIAPMKKNYPTIRIVVPRPRKSSKSKGKAAFKMGEVLLRVSV
jgi:hypothetical protein